MIKFQNYEVKNNTEDFLLLNENEIESIKFRKLGEKRCIAKIQLVRNNLCHELFYTDPYLFKEDLKTKI